MVNKSDTFIKNIVGSREELVDVDSIINQLGDLQELKGIDVIIRRILVNLLVKTYVFDPEYGYNLPKYIFDPTDYKTLSRIENIVQHAIDISISPSLAKIVPSVKFLSNKKGFKIDLNVEYKGKKDTVTLDVDESLLRTV